MKRISRPSAAVSVWAGSLLVLVLQVTSALAQGEAATPPVPAPGKLVDVGGWRLHLHGAGEVRESQPTVVLEAGLGDFSVEWSLVQPGVAKFARVCSYDRAGHGWSDLGPHPRTWRQIVYELHTLLKKGGVKPPLVLVGHSYGGYLVRLYASTYPSEVAGMVLVEPEIDNPWRTMQSGRRVRAVNLVVRGPVPDVKVSNPLRVSDFPPGVLEPMKANLAEAVKHANDPPRDKLPLDARRMRAWSLEQVGHLATAVNPFEIEELASLRAERGKSEHPLGDMPLIVLTRGIAEKGGSDGEALADHHRDHAALAAMSRNGKLVVAANSGHHIHLDEPELVIKSIRNVLAALEK